MGIWEVSSSNFFANNIELSDWVKIHLRLLLKKFLNLNCRLEGRQTQTLGRSVSTQGRGSQNIYF